MLKVEAAQRNEVPVFFSKYFNVPLVIWKLAFYTMNFFYLIYQKTRGERRDGTTLGGGESVAFSPRRHRFHRHWLRHWRPSISVYGGVKDQRSVYERTKYERYLTKAHSLSNTTRTFHVKPQTDAE